MNKEVYALDLRLAMMSSSILVTELILDRLRIRLCFIRGRIICVSHDLAEQTFICHLQLHQNLE